MLENSASSEHGTSGSVRGSASRIPAFLVGIAIRPNSCLFADVLVGGTLSPRRRTLTRRGNDRPCECPDRCGQRNCSHFHPGDVDRPQALVYEVVAAGALHGVMHRNRYGCTLHTGRPPRVRPPNAGDARNTGSTFHSNSFGGHLCSDLFPVPPLGGRDPAIRRLLFTGSAKPPHRR